MRKTTDEPCVHRRVLDPWHGVFSSAHFSPGEIILRIDDSRVVTDADPLDPAKGEFEHHCDYWLAARWS